MKTACFLLNLYRLLRMAVADSCYLNSTACDKKINLPHDEIIFLGRNKVTEIKDLLLSRNQLSVRANYKSYEVIVNILGANYSECNGYAMLKDQTYTLKHGDLLSLKQNEYQYCITFDPPPSTEDQNEQDQSKHDNAENIEPPAKKPKLNFPIFNNSKTLKDKKPNLNVEGGWEIIDRQCLIFTPAGFKNTPKVAAFDLDGTLIRVKSGAQFPKHKDDWELWNVVVPKKLKELSDEDYSIIIFSNQAGIKQDQSKVKDFKEKVEKILQKLSISSMIFISTEKSIYRKPAPGMWNLFLEKTNSKTTIDYSNSFYVGDAAGRPKNWAPGKKKDHSLVDCLFAKNIGLKFYSPEEYFLGGKPIEPTKPCFDPRVVFDVKTSTLPQISSSCEVIIMVGFPGAGKSHFCKEYLVKNGYVYANRDTLKTWQKCAKVVEDALENKKKVVVDNTNPDVESRKRFVALAKKYNVPCRCFVMNVNLDHARHNNKFRELVDESVKVTDIVLYGYNKNFQEPKLDEGFSEIVNVDFVPQFSDTKNENLYKMFLLEN